MNDYIFGQLGLEILKFIQSFSNPILNVFFIIITNFGDVPFYIVVLALIYWLESKKTRAHLAAASIIIYYFTGLLKAFVGWTRPFLAHPTEVKLIGSAPVGYSFPSGHSESTAVFWPLLVHLCTNEKRKKILLIAGILFIILIPFSRVYLGVHYPGDVLVGVIIGFIGVFLYIKYNQAVIDLFKDVHPYILIVGTFALSIVMLTVEIITVLVSNHDLVVSDPGVLPGMFFGALTGFLLEQKYLNFEQKPSKQLFYISRIVIGGMVVVMAYVVGHFAFFLFKGEYVTIFRHYTELTLVGLSIAFIAPLVFTKFEEYMIRRS